MHSAIARSSLSSPIAPRAWHALVALLAFFGIGASSGPAAALGPASETGTVRYTYEQADHAYESLIFGARVSVGSANEDFIGPLAPRASDAAPAVLAARGADDSAEISTTVPVEEVASVGDPARSILRPSGPIGHVYDSTASFVAPSPTDTTRVGRWMSPDEFSEMSDTGRVVEGSGGRTYVVEPPNPAAYPSAQPGSVYAEFDVPIDALRTASKPEWSVIPGPNVTTRIYGPPPL